MFKNLEDLIKTIRDRKNVSPDKSYTNKLLNDKNLSVSKVKEEEEAKKQKKGIWSGEFEEPYLFRKKNK